MNFHTTKKHLNSLVVITLIVSISLGASAKPARAQLGEVGSGLAGCALGALNVTGGGGITSLAAGALGLMVPVTDPIVGGNTTAINAKEYCLDAIVSTIGKLVIRKMTDSIVNWINSGFQGEPLFLSDPEGFFTDIAVKERDYVLWQVENSATIYASDIVVSLIRKERKQYDLGEVVTRSCVEDEEREIAFNSSYEAGDYSTRLARAEQKKSDAPEGQGLFANISSLARRALAQVTGSEEPVAEPAADNPYNPFSGSSELEEGDYGYGRCPASQAEKNLVVRECLAGERGLAECGGGNFWYSLTQNQENNALGAVLSARSDVAARQEAARTRAESDLIANRGFLSEKRCVEYAEPGDDTTPCVREITVTPGSYVAGAADQITASTFRNAELNRELGQAFDEILNAFLNQLMTQGFSALSGQGGVFGRTSSQIFQAGANEIRSQIQLNMALERQLDDAVLMAKQYVLVKKETVAVTRDVVEKLSAIYTIGDGGLSCPAVYEQARNDIAKMSDYSAVANSYENEINVLATDVETLEKLKAEAKNASAAGASDIGTLYARIASRLPNSGSVISAQGELQTIKQKQADAAKWKTDCEQKISGSQPTQQGEGGSI